jgi:hypothetical protein
MLALAYLAAFVSITRRSRSALDEDLLDAAPCRGAMLELPMPNPIREMVKRE